MHPAKIYIKTLASGIDFLGWVHFSDHRILRTSTKKRMVKRIETDPSINTFQSYLGLLRYGSGYKLKERLLEKYNRILIMREKPRDLTPLEIRGAK